MSFDNNNNPAANNNNGNNKENNFLPQRFMSVNGHKIKYLDYDRRIF